MPISGGLEENDYGLLKDLKFELKISQEEALNGGFSLCFWLYLHSSPPFPVTILHQGQSDIQASVPFLLLNERRKIVLFPSVFLHQEAPCPNSTSWTEVPRAFTETELPMKKWVHVVCEALPNFVRLHIDGEIVAEKHLTSLPSNDLPSKASERRSLPCFMGNKGEIQGYVHNVEALSQTSPIKSHYIKDPPLQLSIDSSAVSDIEEEGDGVWSIVGGKASCRRNFSVDLTLLNAFGQPVNEEIEVVASLLYADNGTPVEKSDDAEAPLLTSCDGIEFASSDRPSKLINGRASFKLKISQLSSKCENRLFRIKFDVPTVGKYPFLEACSHPIRCISRSRNTRTPSLSRKMSPGIHLFGGSQSPGLEDGSLEILHNIVREAKASPSSKRIKLGQENSFSIIKDDPVLKQGDRSCSFRTGNINGDNNAHGRIDGWKKEHHEVAENCSSDSENTESTKSAPNNMPSNGNVISDHVVFKYCLGGLTERSFLLKDIAISSGEDDLVNLGEKVSLFSGCSHHRHQINIAKGLVEEGIKAWNLMCHNGQHVPWENLASGIKEQFTKIALSSSRSLTYQDLELLRKIAGCQELVFQENFEKLWCWLYPIAYTLSQEWINAMWNSAWPKWIEGFITKEEAEASLQGPRGLQDPGTFVLRFPTSRSWPHPDAGNLVVTYVGCDYNIHHRLLSLRFIYSSAANATKVKPLQEMLLDVPELSRLGRVVRSQ